MAKALIAVGSLLICSMGNPALLMEQGGYHTPRFHAVNRYHTADSYGDLTERHTQH